MGSDDYPIVIALMEKNCVKYTRYNRKLIIKTAKCDRYGVEIQKKIEQDDIFKNFYSYINLFKQEKSFNAVKAVRWDEHCKR